MCVNLLRKTVKKCLQLAETHKHRSIALPAVSGGIFGFPLELCTYTIVSSIKETLEESKGNSSLKQVHLVGFAQDNIQAFSKAFREVFSDSSLSYGSPHRVSTVPQPTPRKTPKRIKNFPFVTTQEGLNIVLQIGSIEDATVSVLNYVLLKYQVGPFVSSFKTDKHKTSVIGEHWHEISSWYCTSCGEPVSLIDFQLPPALNFC